VVARELPMMIGVTVATLALGGIHSAACVT
jgi:hypothetical protein